MQPWMLSILSTFVIVCPSLISFSYSCLSCVFGLAVTCSPLHQSFCPSLRSFTRAAVQFLWVSQSISESALVVCLPVCLPASQSVCKPFIYIKLSSWPLLAFVKCLHFEPWNPQTTTVDVWNCVSVKASLQKRDWLSVESALNKLINKDWKALAYLLKTSHLFPLCFCFIFDSASLFSVATV